MSRFNAKTVKFNKYVGLKIREARQIKAITGTELAKLIGATLQQPFKYEKENNLVSAPRLWLMANRLDVEIRYCYSDYIDNAAI